MGDFENSPIGSLSPSVELPNLLTVAPHILHRASSKVEARWGESAVITIALSLSQEPTIHAPNSVLICHCPRINFCCTIFVNCVCVSKILTTVSLKIIPQVIVKISKSHVSIIPMANLWEFCHKFCRIWCKIDDFKILRAMNWMDQALGRHILIIMCAVSASPNVQQQFNFVNNSYWSYHMTHLFLKPMWLNWDFLDDDELLKEW